MSDSDLFPVIDRHTWMNHAAISPWPAAVVDAMRGFVESNATRGPLDYGRWLKTEQRLRERAATLLGGRTDDVALVKNTSEGLSAIAAGFDWQQGDAVVCCADDFPSNVLPWRQLVPDGVEVREVALRPDDPEAALIEAMDQSVRLVAVSSVRYDSGVRLDLQRIGTAARESGARFAVDAIQHLGALTLDVDRLPIDFVVAGSHKWLLAPEGLAVFWSRPEARRSLRPVQTGWRMWPDMFDFDRADWSVPTGARRFEPGTLNSAGIHGLDAAIGLLLDIDPHARETALLDRTGRLVEGLERLDGVEVVTPVERARRAGIVCFRTRSLDPDAVLKRLAEADIHAARRGSAVRLSPNFYTPLDQLERTLETIRAALR